MKTKLIIILIFAIILFLILRKYNQIENTSSENFPVFDFEPSHVVYDETGGVLLNPVKQNDYSPVICFKNDTIDLPEKRSEYLILKATSLNSILSDSSRVVISSKKDEKEYFFNGKKEIYVCTENKTELKFFIENLDSVKIENVDNFKRLRNKFNNITIIVLNTDTLDYDLVGKRYNKLFRSSSYNSEYLLGDFHTSSDTLNSIFSDHDFLSQVKDSRLSFYFSNYIYSKISDFSYFHLNDSVEEIVKDVVAVKEAYENVPSIVLCELMISDLSKHDLDKIFDLVKKSMENQYYYFLVSDDNSKIFTDISDIDNGAINPLANLRDRISKLLNVKNNLDYVEDFYSLNDKFYMFSIDNENYSVSEIDTVWTINENGEVLVASKNKEIQITEDDSQFYKKLINNFPHFSVMEIRNRGNNKFYISTNENTYLISGTKSQFGKKYLCDFEDGYMFYMNSLEKIRIESTKKIRVSINNLLDIGENKSFFVSPIYVYSSSLNNCEKDYDLYLNFKYNPEF
ncbi:MAG: hypothetical protein JXR48_08030 [Candidatus Delongbacteria bacterium]|nr:hypothetical protein [Candidatus Delongbacteria bacterium]MBN2834901.1 hypothetical protein [Candidatus Delongbacteria bacterium]